MTRPHVDTAIAVSRRASPASGKYFALLAGVTLFCIASVMAINLLVDPMRYFGGNRITGKNLFFNEREAKVNLYYDRRHQFDCILFGASASTTLDVTAIDGHTCYNFSFSGGIFEEFAAYAQYVKAVGKPPKLIIVAVDQGNLRDRRPPAHIPAFVRTFDKPEPFVQPYLSLEVMQHSLTELFRTEYREQYYNAGEFICMIGPNHIPYTPSSAVRIDKKIDQFSDRNFRFIEQIRATFPGAKFVGYAEYMSSWWTAKTYFEGQLAQVASLRHELAAKFDAFYDFAVPSADTESTADTHDGLHYAPGAKKAFVRAFSGAPGAEVVQPLKLTKAEYVELYEKRITDFIARQKITAVK